MVSNEVFVEKVIGMIQGEFKKSGMTQTALAEKIGENQGKISRFMCGYYKDNKNMPFYTIYQICDGLGIDIKFVRRRGAKNALLDKEVKYED